MGFSRGGSKGGGGRGIEWSSRMNETGEIESNQENVNEENVICKVKGQHQLDLHSVVFFSFTTTIIRPFFTTLLTSYKHSSGRMEQIKKINGKNEIFN